MKVGLPGVTSAVLAAALTQAQPVWANDSMAGMALGGLQFIRSDAVAMVEQFLHITPDRVHVRYVFRNESDETVDGLVAFPLPAMGHPDGINYAWVPFEDSVNYVGFRTTIDGAEIVPNVESRALLLGMDVTGRLQELGVSPLPFSFAAFEAIAALPEATLASLRDDLLIDHFNYPLWVLETSFWRRQSFAPGVDVIVEHEYTPVRGASVGSPVGNVPPAEGDGWLEQMRERYCVERELEEAMFHRQNTGDREYYLTFASSEVEYLLMPGGNWRGPIGRFRLIVEAPHPEDYVFMCEQRTQRVAPNRIEIDEENFWPWRDLDILFAHLVGEGIERDDW